MLPLVRVGGLLEPHFIFGDGVEVDDLLAFPNLQDESAMFVTHTYVDVTYSNDRSDELHEELRDLQERRVEVVQVVDEKALDMRTIVILSSVVKGVYRCRNTES